MHLSLSSAALLLTIGSLASVLTPTAASPSSDLAKCLKPLGSKVITSSNSNYNKQRYAFDLRFDYKPQVIVMAKSSKDVQTAVKCAKDNGFPVAPRSGGHSFEGYCVGGADGAVVIDLTGLGSVKVDKKTGKATVGGGVRLGKLYLELYKQGGYTINAGTCPSVGIGGHALGGGFGLLSRKHGLLIDSIIEMEMVNADGKLLKVSATENKDLFFALRGAGGGSYGVVTSFTLQSYKPAPKVTSFTYDWKLSDHAKVLRAYVDFQASASRDVGVELNVAPDGLFIYGIFQGPKSKLSAALNDFLSKAPKPTGNDIRESTHIEAQLRFAFVSGDPTDIEALALESPYKPGDSRYTKGKSLVYPKALKDSTIALLGKWGAKTPKGSTANYIIIDLWGGAVADVSASATAFIHRDAHTVFEFVSEWDANPNAKPGKPDCKDCLKWMNDMYNEFLDDYKKNYSPVVRGYQNYIDLEIPNWKEAYYGQALPRLQQIKSQADPSNVFRFPQSIPLAK